MLGELLQALQLEAFLVLLEGLQKTVKLDLQPNVKTNTIKLSMSFS